MKKAFTLAELLIALGIIGVLAAILMPIVHNIAPNQNTIMTKRAFYSAQNVVSEMINDSGCYPDKTNSSGNDRAFGFEDGFGYDSCTYWGGSYNTSTIDTEGDGTTKFVTLFMDKLGLEIPTSGTNTTVPTYIESKDGVRWKINNTAFTKTTAFDSPDKYLSVSVDVNGDEKPNCGKSTEAKKSFGDGATVDTNCNSRTSGFDRFALRIYVDGKIVIDPADSWAIDAVKVSKNISE